MSGSLRVRHASSQSLLLRTHIGLRQVMDELASSAVWAVSIGTVLLTKLGLVESGDVSLNHHVSLAMGEGAL